MKVKYTEDAERLRQENVKQMEDQEKRLRNMSEADLQKVRDENAKQQSQMRATFEQNQRSLEQQNASIRAAIRRKEDEISELRATYGNMTEIYRNEHHGIVIFKRDSY